MKLSILSTLIAVTAAFKDPTIARVPALGWNNWNALGCNVSETLLLENAERLVTTGLRDLGYVYVAMDDCWQAVPGRGSDGKLIADSARFPNGMKWIADHLHKQGLLYGMYSSAGHLTCAGYEGSLDHESNDAESFASWGIDYLKYDNCYNSGRHGTAEISFNRYNTMAKALEATGRKILFSICSWGEDFVHMWATSISHSWRVSGDVYDYFSRPDALCSCTDNDPLCIAPGSHCSVLNIINRVAPTAERGRAGGWNDLDMLEVGNGGMSDDEYIAHFSMWAALKSPLLLGVDLRELDATSLSIVNNPAVLAVNQDPLGKPIFRIKQDLAVPKDQYGEGETQVWSGPLYPHDQLVVFLNAADEDMDMSIELSELFAPEPGHSRNRLAGQAWDMYDLWADRMGINTAQKIVDAAKIGKGHPSLAKSYNATQTPYREGLIMGDARLMGTKVGVVEAKGTISSSIPRHSVKMYRLRGGERSFVSLEERNFFGDGFGITGLS